MTIWEYLACGSAFISFLFFVRTFIRVEKEKSERQDATVRMRNNLIRARDELLKIADALQKEARELQERKKLFEMKRKKSGLS